MQEDAIIINGLMQNNKAKMPFIVQLFYTTILLFAAACSQGTKQQPSDEIAQKEQIPPVTTLLSSLPQNARPKVILFDTVPKPPVKKIIKENGYSPKAIFKTIDEKNVQENLKENKGSIVSEAEGRGFFTTYTTDDGLSLDQVYCSYKDKWGNLWFGTNGGGVSKYDGKNFTTYTTAHGLANNVIWCITQDHEGNLWFGTDGSGASKKPSAKPINLGGVANQGSVQ